jgi:hypothetical protein
VTVIGAHTHVTVWAIGDSVRIDDDLVIGRVTAITIRERDDLYEVSWMNNGTPTSAWIEAWRLVKPVADVIGFGALCGD